MTQSALFRPIRKPVKRARAEYYLFITLVSFATSVIVTRIFLELTGYPQIGNSEFHIAHVLWGGLLLFIAALLPLIFANRWVMSLSALAGGVGVGLFIDEVGKFITQNNDYFSPLAAPIIYGFFVLTVLVYVQVLNTSQTADARADLYKILDNMREILDHDLDEIERDEMRNQLQMIIDQPSLEYRGLATALLDFLMSSNVQVIPRPITFGDRLLTRIGGFEERWFTRGRWKTILVIGLGLIGLLALYNLFFLVLLVISPEGREDLTLSLLMNFQQISGAAGVTWYLIAAFLDSILGTLIFIGTVMFVFGREYIGTTIAFLCLVGFLTTVNLLGFYFNSFSAVTTTLLQVLLLVTLIRYRRRYLLADSASGL